MPILPTVLSRAVMGAAVFGVELSDRIVVTPAKVVLILVLAIVFTRIARRGVSRMTRRMKGEIEEGTVLRRGRRRRGRRGRPGTSGSDGTDVVTTPAISTLRAAQRAETVGTLLKSVVTLVVWTFAVLMVLSEVGINVGPLIAGAGFFGVALGFGAQNLVRDFLSGIFMLIEDQYGVGDVIDAGEASGTVEAVSLRTTRLRDVYGVVWYIPNGQILRVGNKSQNWSRALLDVSVAYSTDLAEATRVIEECAKQLREDADFAADILDDPEVWGVENLGPDGIAIRVSIQTRPASQWRVSRELRARLKKAFDEAGIEIPFPQRVIWHRAEENKPPPPT